MTFYALSSQMHGKQFGYNEFDWWARGPVTDHITTLIVSLYEAHPAEVTSGHQ